MNSCTDLPALMTRAETAAYLRVSLPTLARLVRAGKLPALKIGSAVRFTADAVRAMTTSDSLTPKVED